MNREAVAGLDRSGHVPASYGLAGFGRVDTAPTPRLRGVSHQAAFFGSLVAGSLLVAEASDGLRRVAAAVFAATVIMLFAASALYHRVPWDEAAKRWMRRVDHTGIFLLIAGSYTPFGLLALDGPWRISVLAVVWIGAAFGIALRFAWVDAPPWLTVAITLPLGWLSVIAIPTAYGALGAKGFGLLLAGGAFYSLGGLVYALRRPNPWPTTLGFHEVFHLLVVAAVACHYAAVTLIVSG
jgi:hemolysin III